MSKILLISLVFVFSNSSIYAQNDSVKTKFIVDIPLLDLPANLDNNGLAFKQFSPSMQQSLSFTKSISETQQYYTKRIFFNPNKSYSISRKLLGETGLAATNFIIEIIISGTPFGTGWTHEEWHRAVLNKNNAGSFNNMNTFPIGQALVSVSNVLDKDLERFKKSNNPDFVRMSAAGIEAQFEYVKALQKDNFFYDLNLSSQVSYWLNTLNAMGYLRLTSTIGADDFTKELEKKEGTDISKRDFTGLDFTAWIYDLSRPNEAYAERGKHVSGVGFRRYRIPSDLTTEELDYLTKMGKLQILNFVSPHMFFINSIKLNQNLRFNFGLFHYLTSFGYDVGSNFFVEHKHNKIFFAFHNYHNLNNSFYGIETLLIDKAYKVGNKTVLLSPSIHLWTQPKNQEFRTADAIFGGKVEILASTKLGKIWQPYISVSAKTKGWVAGDVYQDSNFSGRLGIRTFIK